MRAEKMSKPNDGIKCVVNTCHYHISGDHCAASQIEITPKNARDIQETDCATFIPENQMH